MKDLLALLSNAADAVCAIDQQGQIVFWNEAAEGLLGLKAKEVLGQMCCEVIAGRDESGRLVCSPHCGARERALRHELVPTQDLRVRTRAGRELWLNVSTIVVPSQWRDLSVLVHLFRDVSRAKEMERFVDQLLSIVENLTSTSATEPSPPSSVPPTLQDLTSRERDVLRLLAAGAKTKTIAKQLSISPSTVQNHINNILIKLRVHSRLEAVTLAMRSGLV